MEDLDDEDDDLSVDNLSDVCKLRSKIRAKFAELLIAQLLHLSVEVLRGTIVNRIKSC